MPSGLTLADLELGLRYLPEIIYPSGRFVEELDKLQRILTANHMSLVQLLAHISPTCADLLVTCMYEGRGEACDRLFVPTLTAYGICCSFNNAVLSR